MWCHLSLVLCVVPSTLGALCGAIYPWCFVWCHLPLVLCVVPSTLGALCGTIYPWCFVWCHLSLVLCVVPSTLGASCGAIYSQCFVWCHLPLVLCVVPSTLGAVCGTIYSQCFVWCHLPLVLCVVPSILGALRGRGTLGWSTLTNKMVSCFLRKNDPKIRLHHFLEGLGELFWRYSRFLLERTRIRKLNMSELGHNDIFEWTNFLFSAKKLRECILSTFYSFRFVNLKNFLNLFYISFINTIQFLSSRTFNSAQPLIKKGTIKQKNTNFTGNNNRFALRSSSGYKN